jgi:bloom syndrome protein
MRTNLESNLEKLKSYSYNPPLLRDPIENPVFPIHCPSILPSFSPSTILPLPSQAANFSWTSAIHSLNRSVFHNQSFRSNQEAVINAVLQGLDIFVCMPTGGGKSLTFQLPAVYSSGITLVVMPLVSLIFDQMTLLAGLGIEVRTLNSSQSVSEQNRVYDDIMYDTKVKLLFLTPEKLSQSDKLNNFLMRMHLKGRIERLAVDEAHCVSQWGRDFRADYMKLSRFRENFAGVPIIALTATATAQVRADVCSLLGMKNPAFFLSSFNRPNLSYEVHPKGKKVIDEVAAYISQRKNQSGLVYCISKKDCESVSSALNESFNIKAGFYHADLPTTDRNSIQTLWMRGEIQVLVATIAFGMGIDKKNCRFVIHFSLPKSLEGYYQESGRAGRDGQQADCILYFSYADKIKQEFLITKSLPPGPQQDKRLKELNNVIDYCEDSFTCRRKMQLEYFGEQFDSVNCNKTCDNCISGRNGYEKDVTENAIQVIRILQGPRNRINTLLQIAALLKGGSVKRNEEVKTHESFGILKECSRDDIEKMLKKMIRLDILKEKPVKNFKNVINNIVELGDEAMNLVNGNVKVKIMCEAKKPVILVSSNQNCVVRKLDDLAFKREKVDDSCNLSEEQKEDLRDRLSIVLKGLERKSKKKRQEIVSNEDMEILINTAPSDYPGVPKELLSEIQHFKEICEKENEDPYTFDIDLENIDIYELDQSLKRTPLPMPYSSKSVKLK